MVVGFFAIEARLAIRAWLLRARQIDWITAAIRPIGIRQCLRFEVDPALTICIFSDEKLMRRKEM
jgi:hypothetical protein